MDNNSKYLNQLFQFVDSIHNYFFFNNYQDLASDIINIHEKMLLLKPEESFKDKLEYEDYEKSFDLKVELIKKNIFRPAENDANKFNIFIFIDDDYDPFGILEERHYDYLLNTVYQNTLDVFMFKSKSPLPLSLKRKMLQYIELRENITLCSHMLSRMILCFDLIVKKLLNFYNINTDFHKTMCKPFRVIYEYSTLKIFNPHLIGLNELKSEIDELIHRCEKYSYHSSSLDPQILGLTLNEYYIDQIKKNLDKMSIDEGNYLVDEILDLNDRLKQNLDSRSSQTFLDNFSARIDSLRKTNTFEIFQDKEINRHKDLKNTLWFYSGIKLLTGEIDKLYDEYQNFTRVAEKLSNEKFKTKSLRPYISESYQNTTPSDKNILSRKDLTKLVEYLKGNNIKISPKYQHLDIN